MPRWCNPDNADEDKSDDHVLGFDPRYGRVRYSYLKGEIVFLF
jgi:hypothetical protein